VRTGGSTWDVYVANDGVQINSQEVMRGVVANETVIAARTAYNTAVAGGDAAAIVAARQAYASTLGTAVTAAATAAGASPAALAQIAALYDPATSVGNVASNTPDLIDAAFANAVNVPAERAGSLIFTKNGLIDSAAMQAAGFTLPFNVTLPVFPDNGAFLQIPVALTFDGSTQYGTETSEKNSTQDGYSSGSLQRFAADENGIIMGQYSNGKSRALGQVVLADFASVDNLTPLGNNAWAESGASGVPQIGTPNTGGMGQLRASSVESSNVDLTEQLVDMITAQRVYQANAQTIKTEDSILQTLINLR
jgi:flagellar hook protein FlgE